MFTISCTPVKNSEKQDPRDDREGRFIQVKDGTKIFVYDYRPSEKYENTIFILSGVTGINHNAEKDIIELLSNKKNRVVTIHPRGTGYSDGRRGDTSDFEDLINDHIEIIGNDIDYIIHEHKIILYGHSMSAAFALSVAAKLNCIDGIVLVNPPLVMKNAKGMSPSAGEYIKYAFYFLFARHTPVVNMAGDPEKIKDPEDRKDAISRINDPLLVRYFSIYMLSRSRRMIESMPVLSQQIGCPLLLLYGTNDNITDIRGCERIMAAWKGSQKQFLKVEGGSHGKGTVLRARDSITEWIGSQSDDKNTALN
jgi:alpha-beta hydrolase superfamily lysophospholipase